jgi:cytoskeletal protein CcmA (bactofilin family)
MAQTILIKRSTSTATPTALANGELAYSASSNKLFVGRPGGGTGDIDAIGGKYYTDILTGATASNTASKLVLRDGSGNFAAGTITGALTGNASTATTLATARNFSVSGDITAPNVAFNGSAVVGLVSTLATVNSNVGNFGTTTAIPVITVNAKGLVTAVSTAAIVTSWNLDADTGTTNAVAGGETLTVAGGTGVATSVSGNTVSIAIGQAVATTSNVTFNNVAVNGTLSSDDITAATMTASGHVVVQGNLTVNGTTTTVNSNTVAIGDSIMTLNSDETGTPSENAGFEVERGTSTNVSVLWNEGSDYWQINDGSTTSKVLSAGNFAASFTGTLDGGTY